eukprot:Gregarina_sp_Poly_1__3078@NODE_1867_length_3162_cov_62_837480_g1211_i0_p1_GENE_NODE_1867_length_3162_cov_62_837480_g1211_i0NODE_1867_length_3162_cov_62_837480_g1211_i0_p1_ORF_typecomplete_len453_score24_76_NODE_1867_length_3162_cov_62_837480_g1211_i018023031
MVENHFHGLRDLYGNFTKSGEILFLRANEPHIEQSFIQSLEEDPWLGLILSTRFISEPTLYLTDERIIWATDLVQTATPFNFYGNHTPSYLILNDLVRQAAHASIEVEKFPSLSSRTLPWLAKFKYHLYPLSALSDSVRDILRPTCPAFSEIVCVEIDSTCRGAITIGLQSVHRIPIDVLMKSEMDLKNNWNLMVETAQTMDLIQMFSCMKNASIHDRVSLVVAINLILLKSVIYSNQPVQRTIESYVSELEFHDTCPIGGRCYLFATRSRNATTTSMPVTQVPLQKFRELIKQDVISGLRLSNSQLGIATMNNLIWLNAATRLWRSLKNTPNVFSCNIARDMLERIYGSVCRGTSNSLVIIASLVSRLLQSSLAVLWSASGVTGLLGLSLMLLLKHSGLPPQASIAAI